MKNGLRITQLAKTIEGVSKDLGGVFTFSDLWNLIGLASSDRTAKVVDRLVREGVLQKVRRGLYVAKDGDLWVLATRLRENAYVSLDSVLAREGLIGPLPKKSVSLVSTAPPKSWETPLGRIRYFRIKPDLVFGLKKEALGVRTAKKEKAFLDLLYFHVKGARFAIDPRKDVDLWKLDRKTLRQDLKRYANPKFRRFAEGVIRGSD